MGRMYIVPVPAYVPVPGTGMLNGTPMALLAQFPGFFHAHELPLRC